MFIIPKDTVKSSHVRCLFDPTQYRVQVDVREIKRTTRSYIEQSTQLHTQIQTFFMYQIFPICKTKFRHI